MANGEIYTSETGGLLVRFSDTAFHGGDRAPSQTTGWREKLDGTREFVSYHADGVWMTDTERNTARIRARDSDRRYR
ncbi:hypothetical protein HY418_03090 [Candidatus Kaiserbacteria bacterium]|nr:hypothetical protein [Candidatus Kaiserbacteria bacterium]